MRPTNSARIKLRQPCARRRGVASVLAMLFLVLFSALALGFHAQTTMSAQMANSERRGSDARVAAESGMAFMRYQLASLGTEYKLNESEMLVELANVLADRLNGTANLTAGGYQEVGMTATGDAILIPNDEDAVIPLGNGLGFRCKITRTGRSFVVKVVGRAANGSTAVSANSGRGVEYTYEPKQKSAPLFEYGVAGRGVLELLGNGAIRGGTSASYGNVLTTTLTNPAVTTSSNAVISGTVSLTNPLGTTNYHASSQINGGTSAAVKTASTFKGVAAPEFPVIDTSIYLPFIKRTVSSSSGVTVLKNARIPANSNLTFSGVTIEGILYIEQPNNITINSDCVIRGTIVTPSTYSGTGTRQISLAGKVTAYDMSTLATVYDMSVAANATEFPPALRALTGASILAPGFSVSMTGGYDSVSGTVVAERLTIAGNATGNITGALIALGTSPLSISGSGAASIQRPAAGSLWPAGMYFRSAYFPLSSTYREFHPSIEGM